MNLPPNVVSHTVFAVSAWSLRYDMRESCKYGSRWVHVPNEARVLFYNESLDRCVRAFLPGLTRIFAKHVHEEVQPDKTAVDTMGFRMSFRQFFDLLDQESELFPGMLTPLAARQIFNEAKMEAIVGVASAKTNRLSFCDFIDALCRIAYYLAPFQPVENVLLLLFDLVFFHNTKDTDMDRRFFRSEQRHMLQNVTIRMTVRGRNFFAKKDEPLQSIYQAHVGYIKDIERSKIAEERKKRTLLPGSTGILLFNGMSRGKGF